MKLKMALRNRKFLVRAAFVIVIIAWPALLRDDYALSVMSTAGIYATLALGLGLLLGQAGQISLGHAAFFGMGAYTSAIFATKLQLPPILGLVVGAALAGCLAYIVGRPILRLKSYFLALATLGLGEIFVVVAREMKWLTGGQVGIVAIPWFNIGSFEFAGYLEQYYLVWGLVLLLLFFTERALASRVGRALRALAVSEVAASTLGIHTADWKLRTFVLSAVYAGLGGGLYAFVISAINYNNFSGSLSLLVMIMVIVGGSSSLFGAVVGAVLISWLGHAFSGYQEYSGSLYALVLILLLLFLPGGLAMGIQSKYTERIRQVLLQTSKRALARLGFPRKKDILAGDHSLNLTPDKVGPASQMLGYNLAIDRWLAGKKTTEDAASFAGPLLRLEGINVFFGGVRAVDQVSMTLTEGSISSLIGPNGAGKTTLFNTISGVQQPTAGRVWFMGREITNLPTADIAELGIARTFQNLRIFGNMTVLENVMVGRHKHEKAGFFTAALGMQAQEEQESRQRSLEALGLVGLEHLADWLVTSLPYGQQRLVEIARAMATEPRLLLLDEPGAGMNATEKVQLIEQVKRIRQAGVTVLLVEHDLEMVMGISDRITVLNFGKLIAEGDPREVQAHPEVIEAYVGVKHEGRWGGSAEAAVGSVTDTTAVSGQEDKMLLEVQNVYTSYGSISAVRDVSLQVKSGEIVGVLGSNGAGKTTLLRTISGILRPRSGKIIFNNIDLVKMAPQNIAGLGIGHVPEGRHIFPTLSVYDNLLLGATRRRDKKQIQNDCEFVYNLFPVLSERSRQIAGTLSGGQQQMLAIGRALMGQPKLLLLDEPSMGLAPLVVEQIFETLVKLNQEGLTLVIVEQNAEIMLSIAHHAFVMQTGRVALSGRAEDLARDERVQALYLGHGQGEPEETGQEADRMVL